MKLPIVRRNLVKIAGYNFDNGVPIIPGQI